MNQEAETLIPEPERTPEAYWRDLYRARLVIGQPRDKAMASGDPFQVADLALDAAALDDIWDGLDRVDSHFWEEKSFRRYMESREGALPAGTERPGGSSGGWLAVQDACGGLRAVRSAGFTSRRRGVITPGNEPNRPILAGENGPRVEWSHDDWNRSNPGHLPGCARAAGRRLGVARPGPDPQRRREGMGGRRSGQRAPWCRRGAGADSGRYTPD